MHIGIFHLKNIYIGYTYLIEYAAFTKIHNAPGLELDPAKYKRPP